MRILVLSNFYPPHFRGGYELGCRNVVEALRARGHEVKVLTSRETADAPGSEGEVYRWLDLDPVWKAPGEPFRRADFVARLLQKEKNNQTALRRICRAWRPDVVYAWKLHGISISLAFVAQKRGLPVCYCVLDDWLSRWEDDPFCWLRDFRPRSLKGRCARKVIPFVPKLLGLVSPSGDLDLGCVQFASAYLKQHTLRAGKPVAGAEVIPFTLQESELIAGAKVDHRGLVADRYAYKQAPGRPKRLLYLGPAALDQGIRTVVEAFKRVVEQPCPEALTLTLIGDSARAEDKARVRDFIQLLGLEGRVCFRRFVAREERPAVYQEHDLLIVASALEAPWDTAVLEAMSSGLAVIGTAAGRSGEMMRDEINALVFPEKDARRCAEQIRRLVNNTELFEQIRRTGRRTVEDRLRFEGIVDQIESSLQMASEKKTR
jgi:glycosyltransferase involved in cell wall biosynthesis